MAAITFFLNIYTYIRYGNSEFETPPCLKKLFLITTFQWLKITNDSAKFTNVDLDQDNCKRSFVFSPLWGSLPELKLPQKF